MKGSRFVAGLVGGFFVAAGASPVLMGNLPSLPMVAFGVIVLALAFFFNRQA